jgi:hypothetical protein
VQTALPRQRLKKPRAARRTKQVERSAGAQSELPVLSEAILQTLAEGPMKFADLCLEIEARRTEINTVAKDLRAAIGVSLQSLKMSDRVMQNEDRMWTVSPDHRRGQRG